MRSIPAGSFRPWTSDSRFVDSQKDNGEEEGCLARCNNRWANLNSALFVFIEIRKRMSGRNCFKSPLPMIRYIPLRFPSSPFLAEAL